MIALQLAEIRRLCQGELVVASGTSEVTGVRIDSRRVEEGDLFVAVGRGREYVADALERGAAAALVPSDPHTALAALGGAVRSRTQARVVAVTGSMGKTSTKDVLAGLCAAQRPTIAAEASYNAELGVPLTLCRIESETEIAILELAMRGFGQIAELCRFSRPEVGVLTAVAPVHLELVGSLEGVARAKAELIDALPAGGIAVVPTNVRELEPLLDRRDLELVRFGREGDVRLTGFEPLGERSRVEIDAGGERVALELPFNIRHQAENVLAAVATYRALGLPLADVQRGADGIVLSRWRVEEVPLPAGGLLINDCWNANPISMRAALEHLVERAGGRRRVAVLGQMAELGREAPAFHRQVAAAVAATGLAALVTVGPLAREYLDGSAGVPVVREAATAEEAASELEEILEPGDVVLIKGARALGLEAVADAVAGATV